jgi:hypothetical protein
MQKRPVDAIFGNIKLRRQFMEKTMRGPHLLFACGLLALISIYHPAIARAQDTKGKNCRMEQQCHWENFKKICTWVKVCR